MFNSCLFKCDEWNLHDKYDKSVQDECCQCQCDCVTTASVLKEVKEVSAQHHNHNAVLSAKDIIHQVHAADLSDSWNFSHESCENDDNWQISKKEKQHHDSQYNDDK